MNIVITGSGGHGKDTVTNLLLRNLLVAGSSSVACEQVVFPKLATLYGYTNHIECFNDRRNHRSEWYEIIKEFNRVDPTALGRLIFNSSDVYNGIRNIMELNALRNQGMVDVTIWVDGSDRLPPESSESLTIKQSDCDYVLNNNGPETDLPQQVIDMLCWIIKNVKTGE